MQCLEFSKCLRCLIDFSLECHDLVLGCDEPSCEINHTRICDVEVAEGLFK